VNRMGGWICLECGNAISFYESAYTTTRVEQEIDDDGNVEAEDTNIEDAGDNPNASCGDCNSERCVWIDNLEDLSEHFENAELYNNFITKLRQKNNLNGVSIPNYETNANNNNSKKKIDINSKLGESG